MKRAQGFLMGLALAVLALSVMSVVVMFLWNVGVTAAFAAPELDYKAAAALTGLFLLGTGLLKTELSIQGGEE